MITDQMANCLVPTVTNSSPPRMRGQEGPAGQREDGVEKSGN